MRVRVVPGGTLQGEPRVPGDKSIAHRWLILAATARGRSRLVGLPASLDVRSTAACLALVSDRGRPALEAWARNVPAPTEGHGSTWNDDAFGGTPTALEVEGEGRSALTEARASLDCGNSGTTMRLVAGTLAAAPFPSILVGDVSLSTRPMERVAAPLREMGATVTTTDGHAPLAIVGGPLCGISYTLPVPTAQVKGAVLFAGIAAEGETTVTEPVATRDHTERAFVALGAPLAVDGTTITLQGIYQHDAFAATVPGDISSAAFLVAAASLTGSEMTVRGVGLNPSRLHFLRVLERMGVRVETRSTGEELGEPVGDIWVAPGAELRGTEVAVSELPLVIDEVPVLAVMSTQARGETWFMGAAELRAKESDRLAGVADGLRALGGHAAVEGDDLVVPGLGLRGGVADGRGDHRLAMAFAVAALAADAPSEIEGMEAADVSFPGFLETLRALGASVEDAT
ncbi:MAG: 3-phosphoshikimate 1-carboxyvinyltransferase [Actinomycetota bacterium]